jgi:hypothetical protein
MSQFPSDPLPARSTTAEPSVGSLQRTLVSSSLLRAGGELRGRKNGR